MATVSKLPLDTPVQAGSIAWLNDCIERGKRGAFGEMTTLTPGLAGELLRRNDDNRGVKITKAIQYASDMRAGRWTFNGEPIIVSSDGKLNDGQHRCIALVDANVSLQVMLVFGLPRETRLTVDQGAAKGASDYLAMDGVANASSASTIARLIIAYEKQNGETVDGRYVTNGDVMARVRSDASIEKASTYAVSTGRKANAFAAGTLIGFCFYIFSQVDEADAREFLNGLCTGVNLNPQSPVLVCREKLMTMGKARQPKLAVIFRAWNMYRRGVARVRSNGLISVMPLPAVV